ncbi:hypothetical protein BFJ63_vAg18236 [Fusarium oxysporum f. sp. narcissi]|uniref:Uncharacterized protein n=1 Tax=Fusarium oxysporum f. sp. narcissi TaxID=451672 RepID=A0A4Q2V2L3_FUSOX|nr:hypothetical protein BFJ63_vAg18236 [Fusarium oxysporum f. sp. narcissi]
MDDKLTASRWSRAAASSKQTTIVNWVRVGSALTTGHNVNRVPNRFVIDDVVKQICSFFRNVCFAMADTIWNENREVVLTSVNVLIVVVASFEEKRCSKFRNIHLF